MITWVVVSDPPNDSLIFLVIFFNGFGILMLKLFLKNKK
jgi:hypothetical protein